MAASSTAQIRFNRTQHNNGRGMKMNKLDEGVDDTFGLVRLLLSERSFSLCVTGEDQIARFDLIVAGEAGFHEP